LLLNFISVYLLRLQKDFGQKLANMALELVHWFIIGFLLILPILYELSSTFRYHAKFTLYYACIMGISSVVCMYGWIRPGDVNNHW